MDRGLGYILGAFVTAQYPLGRSLASFSRCMVVSRGTYESLPLTMKRIAMTSSQAHRLLFSVGGGQTQLFNVECQSGRTIL
jgi:hypothetical protein